MKLSPIRRGGTSLTLEEAAALHARMARVGVPLTWHVRESDRGRGGDAAGGHWYEARPWAPVVERDLVFVLRAPSLTRLRLCLPPGLAWMPGDGVDVVESWTEPAGDEAAG